ncbi:hypothetical protein R3P38DRAFT_2808337 [Favolaschia claudopus]|uniref:Uncharacterized protein n=1 Tax=Favolaschia claudopus TaxID=2862362 RepID=A0AAV9ZG95_9AGAR
MTKTNVLSKGAPKSKVAADMVEERLKNGGACLFSLSSERYPNVMWLCTVSSDVAFLLTDVAIKAPDLFGFTFALYLEVNSSTFNPGLILIECWLAALFFWYHRIILPELNIEFKTWKCDPFGPQLAIFLDDRSSASFFIVHDLARGMIKGRPVPAGRDDRAVGPAYWSYGALEAQVPHAAQNQQEGNVEVDDGNSSVDAAGGEEELVLVVDPSGNYKPASSPIADYQSRGEALKDISIWDFVARIDKDVAQEEDWDEDGEDDRDGSDNLGRTHYQDFFVLAWRKTVSRVEYFVLCNERNDSEYPDWTSIRIQSAVKSASKACGKLEWTRG